MAAQDFLRCVTRMFGELWGIPAHSRYWAEPYVPHANPCSMSRADLAALAAAAPGSYTVAPKSNGERAFLLVGLEDDAADGSERVFGVLVSRSYHTLRRLPGVECREYADAALGRAVCEACYGTLLDGELLPPPKGPGGPERFVVHDAVAVSGCCMLREPHSARLAAAARVAATLSCGGGLDIQFKQWLPLARVRDALGAAVWANADGLIFAPEHAPLTHGKNRQLFKWKAPHDITLDFILTPDRRLVYSDEGREVDAAAAGGFTLSTLRLPDDVPLPCIVECACNANKQLHFVRVRCDKTTPNDACTVRATLLNVAENVTEAEVVRALAAASDDDDDDDSGSSGGGGEDKPPAKKRRRKRVQAQ